MGARSVTRSFSRGYDRTVPSALAAFDDTARGDSAPEWVTRGIHESWELPSGAKATLIVLSENVTFRVDVDGAPRMVVRLSRPDTAIDAAQVRSELAWIRALREDRGIPTPAPVVGAEEALVQTIRDESDRVWTAVAFEWAPGEVLEDRPDFATHLGEIGRITAQLHLHAQSWRPPRDFVRFEWELPDLVGEHARWGDWRRAPLSERETDLLEEAERRAKAVLAEATKERARDAFGLIHADLRPSNALVGAAGELTIIDFDDAGYGWYRTTSPRRSRSSSTARSRARWRRAGSTGTARRSGSTGRSSTRRARGR